MSGASGFPAAAEEYYRRKLKEHGPGAAGMDWRDRQSQHLRFEVIARHIDWSLRPSVLDVGCGDGELLAFCRERGLELSYSGIDVCPEMVAACSARFGSGVARVGTTHELAEGGLDYDYVVASGAFNVRQDAADEAWREYFHTCLEEMFAACRRGVVANVMTSYVDYRYDHLYYAEPQELADLAVRALSRRFLIDHSYPLYELTFAVWRPEA